MLSTLEHANAYIALGHAVLPVHKPLPGGTCGCSTANCKSPGKHPVAIFTPHGIHDATHDPADVLRFFQSEKYNIGIATGRKSGIVVVDVDGDEGKASIAAWKSNGLNLGTPTVVTSKGYHYYLQYPAGHNIPSSAGTVAPGIDIRGDGGMVVAPPSLHHSGIEYQWETGQIPSKGDYAPMPIELVELIVGKGQEHPGLNDDLGQSFKIPTSISDGQGREFFIVRYAGHLRAQGMPQGEIEKKLLEYNQNCIHPPLDVEVVLDRARRYSSGSSTTGFTTNGPTQQTKPPSEGDAANGIEFANAHRNQLIYVLETNEWMQFNPACGWNPASTVDIDAAAKEVAKDLIQAAADEIKTNPESNGARKRLSRALKANNLNSMRAMIEMAKSEPDMSCSCTVFDANPMLLGVQNGIYDLQTKQLLLPVPSMKVLKRCAVSFDPVAECPRFESFLAEVLPDKEVRDFIQRWIGYCLIGRSNEKKFVMLIGVGDNGKSILIEISNWLLGSYAKKIATELLMTHQRNPQGPSPDIVDLKGMRLVYANETSEGQRLADARIKDMTGGDTLTGRVPYGKSAITFAPTHKLMLIGNHKPIIADTSSGMWGRVVLIPFDVVIPKEQRDRHLLEKLQQEGSGILNWALEGFCQYEQIGLAVPDCLDAATNSYREEQDILGDWLTEHCNRGPDLKCKIKDAYQVFQQWCRDNGHGLPSKNTLTRRLATALIKQSPCRKYYLGIDLNSDGSTSMGKF